VKPGTFVIVQVHELPALLELGPQVAVLLAIRLLTKNGSVTTRRRDVQSVTGISDDRRARYLIARLQRLGFIEYCGHPKDRWGLFKMTRRLARRHGENKPGSIFAELHGENRPESHGENRPVYTSQDVPTELLDVGSLHPSQSETPRARARAREDSSSASSSMEGGREVKDELVILVRELWPNVALRVAAKHVATLRTLVTSRGVGDDELAAYLRHSAADETLARAKLPIAAACTADRVEPYFTRRARARRPAARERERSYGDQVPPVSPAETVRLAQEALQKLRRPSR